MKQILISLIFFSFVFISPISVHAQGMMGQNGNSAVQNTNQNSSTTEDEVEGKEVFDKLQSKQVTCKDLTEDGFDVLGDYYMGQRMGGSHENMNNMMKQTLGDEGEKQMHVSMGKRLSGCDVSAPIPSQGAGFLSMIGMMNGRDSQAWIGGGRNMMGNFSGGMMGTWGIFGLLTWVLLIIFLGLGSVYFWKEVHRKNRNK